MARQKLSPLDEASDRLAAVFTRLEHAVRHRPPPAAAQTAELENLNNSWSRHCEALESDIHSLRSDNEALREENNQLSNQLQQVQQEYLALRETNESVARKLEKKAKQLELLA